MKAKSSFIPFSKRLNSLDHESDSSEHKRIRVVNNYSLVKKIGCGRYSKVFLAINGDKRYAVKRISLKDLSRTTNGVMQLEREIRLMRRFNHKNILKLHEVLHSVSEDHVYLILELAECGSIESLLNRGYQFEINSIRSIIKQISDALHYIHSKGFVHQDVKPGNILLSSEGRILLADFGIGHSFLSAAMVVGTPAFQAPEALNETDLDSDFNTIQIDDEPNEPSFYMTCQSFQSDRSYKMTTNANSSSDSEEIECPQVKEDVWALGVTLYQLLFNQLPYTGQNLYEIVSLIKSTNLIIPKTIDPTIEHLLKGMLTVDPVSRFSLDDVLNHPFIKDAPNLVTQEAALNVDLKLSGSTPSFPNNYSKSSDFVNQDYIQISAITCPKDYSFAHAAMTIQHKLELIQAPYSPIRPSWRPPISLNQTSSLPRMVNQFPSHIELADEDRILTPRPLISS